MKNKPFALGTSILVVILCTTITLVAGGFLYFDRPVSAGNTETSLFTVTHGTSLRVITQNLAGQQLIRSEHFAYIYSRIFDLSLKAGTYKLSPGMSTSHILRNIAGGKQEYIRVTVPEGLSLMKTARHLESAGVVSVKDFMAAARDPTVLNRYGLGGKNAEGFLFPDTYFFPYKTDAVTVVATMVDNFFRKTASLENKPADPAELYDKVILASIVEREYRVAAEAPRIASVFVNRLKIGMGLQSCATVEYIITEIQNKPHPTRVTDDDLAIRNDYNTYLWAGLPPGPIASPGLVALQAALNPEETKFLYFRLTDPSAGTHSFTYSLDEHVKVGRQYILKTAAGD